MRLKLSALSSLIAFSLFSNPADPTIVQGSAHFDGLDGGTLSITTSDQAFIEWRDFSIGEGELTQFFQPSSSSVVVNQVTGKIPSTLMGTLKANGKVFLLNPSGILVGEKGVIDTNGFFASTLFSSPLDLLSAGASLLFQASSEASIINLGTIHAWDGDVVLISFQIDNQGTIEAPRGKVSLASGQEILLQPEGMERILIRPDSDPERFAQIGIDQAGRIRACEVELKAEGNPYAYAIRHTGSIDALGIEERGGKILLVAEEGYASIQGDIAAKEGGRVQVLGEKIAILKGSEIDVSGEMGGGEVLIGGNAEKIAVEKGAYIAADALAYGDGGRVLLKADDTLIFYGEISARGGPEAGNGGFVELSSNHTFDCRGTTDRLAPKGKPGTLLFDPIDLTIVAPNQQVTGSSPFAPDGSGCSAQLDPATIEAALVGGDVVVQSSGSGACAQSGNIYVDSPISWNSSHSLTLDTTVAGVSSGSILFSPSSNITNSGNGPITLLASGGITVDSTLISTLGNCTLTANSAIQLTANSAETKLTSGGTATLTSTSGDITLQGSLSGAGFFSEIDAALVNLSAQNVTLSGGSQNNTFATIHAITGIGITCANTLTLQEGSAPVTTASLVSTGPITLIVDNAFPSPPGIGSGAFNLSANSSISTTSTLRIFTAEQGQNTILGTLNGSTFTPGPLFVDSATEQWNTYYPSSFGGTPYTLFYKNGPEGPEEMHLRTQKALLEFNIAAYEWLQDIRDFDRVWFWNVPFTVNGIPEYSVLRPTYKESNGKITYLVR
ncbi:MAG: filamentous hemagglutinin N-terminal domain-containing protein [Verrucomicrobia bacterium]|nr:filamentous hemagglutinin N-terminal domain-containing protein [Verrucomicrobiota bacterium]